jgi:cytochrome bd-type quinol oxidase subunit 2
VGEMMKETKETKQQKLSSWLKAMLIGTGICGTIFLCVIIFGVAGDILQEYPEFSSWYLPWTIFLLLTALPCYLTLFIGWQIADNIRHDKSFIMENVNKMRLVSKLAAGDALFFFLGNIVLFLCGMNHPGILLLSLFVSFAGVVISVGMAVLTYHAEKATELQDENDLTI